MRPKHLLLCAGIILPMTLLSCDDSKTPTETSVNPTTDNEIDAPSFTAVGFGSRWHDPHIVGVTVYCFSGNEDDAIAYNGDCKRFRSKDGVEVNTFDGDEMPSNAYAGFYGKTNLIKGKLLRKVSELDFSYAGGAPSGGAPRFSIPIDECTAGVPVLDITTTDVAPLCTTDGKTDGYAFADVTDASGCNDGDGFVGVLNGEDDTSCNWYYKTEAFTSWTDFETKHPEYRIATDAVPFVIVDQPGHYLLFKWDVR